MNSRRVVHGTGMLGAHSLNVLWLKRKDGGCGWWCNVVEFCRQVNRLSCVPCHLIALASLEKSSQPPQTRRRSLPTCIMVASNDIISRRLCSVFGQQAKHRPCIFVKTLRSSAALKASSRSASGGPGLMRKSGITKCLMRFV